MTREITVKGKTIEYDLQIKKVKNINLRIHSDGKVSVSANRWVSKKVIDSFVASKADLILGALAKIEEKKAIPRVQYYSEKELKELVLKLCREAYPHFEKRGVAYPEIKFRKMVSQWGNCHPTKGVLTFNTNLIYAPLECIEYVVLHEFTHFLVANHSKEFYGELLRICPKYKEMKNKLKDIRIRD